MIIPLEPFIYLMLAIQIVCGVFFAVLVALGVTGLTRFLKRRQNRIKRTPIHRPQFNPAG